MINGRTPAPIDQDGALDFEKPKKPAPSNGATIHLAFQGVPVDLQVADKKIGQIEQLISGLLARGWSAPPQPRSGGFGGRPSDRVKPEMIDGKPCCPVHKKALRQVTLEGGRSFWSCPSKAAEGEKANAGGWCAIKFEG